MKIKIDIKKISSIFFIVPAIIIIYAVYQADSTLGTSAIRNILRLIVYVSAFIEIIIVCNSLKTNKVKLSSILAIIPMILFYFISMFNYNGDISYSGSLMLLFWILYCLSTEEVQAITFSYLKKVFCVISIVGILSYLLYIIGVSPIREISYYTTSINAEYIDYGVSFLYKEDNIIRLCGICNEPGALGTFCALILCASNLNLKEKSNLIIFIAGCLTFSVAFVVIIIIYLLLKSTNNFKIFCLMIMLVLAYINILPNIETEDASFNTLIKRISIDDNGSLVGDNRSNEKLDNLLKYSIREKPILGFGDGYVTNASIGAVLSYKVWLINYGIVGCLLIWGALLISALYGNMKKINVIFFIIVFFASIYQRPGIMTLTYEIILYGGIIYMKKNNKKIELLKSKDID